MIRDMKRSLRLRGKLPAVGYRADGSPIFAIAGGADDGEEEEEQGGEEEEEESEEDEDEDDREDEEDSSGTVSKAEFKRIQKRMKAADRRADQAEQKLREIEDEEKSDLERAQRDLEEATSRTESLASENKELKVRLAVASEASGQVHDLDDVLLNLDLDKVIDDDGDADRKQVKKELKDLRKRKPYLFTDGDEGEEEEEEEEEKPPRTGRLTGKGKKKGEQPDRAKLEKKYPALRR